MTSKKNLLPLIALPTLLAAQCSAYNEPIVDFEIIPITIAPTVVPGLQRVVDEEAGVVCYGLEGKDGIYCMLISETKLKTGQ